MPLHIETPLITSATLSRTAGCIVDLKLECLQPSGSFKLRGIGHACEFHARRGARRFLSSSGGNAGIAVAYAGRRLSVPVVVVVPTTTTARAKQIILAEGADLIVHGDSWQEAHAHLLAISTVDDAVLHPFDDPLVWTGHASMIDEAARQGPRPDAVVVAVGGGGLFCGVVEGLRRNGWDGVRVIAVETEGAASFAAAIAAGRPVPLPAITSIATSLGAKQVCDRAHALSGEHPVTSVVVGDAVAVAACLRFVDDHRMVVEPACGAALAVTAAASGTLADCDRVLVIVCGGVTATTRQLEDWSARSAT